jgi:hypothetical protein
MRATPTLKQAEWYQLAEMSTLYPQVTSTLIALMQRQAALVD